MALRGADAPWQGMLCRAEVGCGHEAGTGGRAGSREALVGLDVML